MSEKTDAAKGEGVPSFEDEIEALGRSVESLERGDLTLEQAIACFESGFRSMRRCYTLLSEAQKRIEVLCASQDADGEIEWKPFPLKDLDLRSGNDGEDDEDSAVDDADDG